ncbi:acyltransferase [Adhaeribacter sp. BT258]|uniref:Acyltransferase n=1 Tax=Adhaeribacter terrigena TaxID=2793070 RepID=A0ABS1BWM4_9BACT|nr:acyltransferase [Adhaeribacter terrigena]MBK0401533.1 acyltransferase [Adhaeribacter terrigena]
MISKLTQLADPLHPLFALGIFLLAFLTGFLINKILKPGISSLPSRYETIDGLRGLLGIGVFIHHASIWHQYLQTGTWTLTSSNLFNHFGQTSVALFFMISAFLFTKKLIQARKEPFDWAYFFVSRFFRLVPMYYFSLAIIILYVLILSDWQIQRGFSEFLVSVLRLGLFEIPGETVLNGHALANLINAKITWTLRFEWLFYFSLPLLSLFILKVRPAVFYLVASIAFLLIFYKYHGLQHYHDYLSFAGGIITAFLTQHFSINSKRNQALTGLIILACLLAIPQFETADNVVCKALIFLVFLLFAGGADLFGVFRNQTLKFLGDICYSTYLLHGILLFTVFYFGFGLKNAKQLSPAEFSGIIFSLTPVLVILSYAGFRFIEKPAIRLAGNMKLKRSKSAAKNGSVLA